MKAGGFLSMCSPGGGRLAPSPYKKGIGLKCMFIAQLFMGSSKKKKLDR